MHLRAAHALLLTATLLLLASACSKDVNAGEARGSAASSGASSTAAATETTRRCPNLHGGDCLGLLEAGQYTTAKFAPALTYSVPVGWDNEEDLPGNFLLIPPGGDLAGVDAGTSDYIGVYSAVQASGGCDGPPEGGARTPEQIAATIQQDPDLEVTRPTATEVGGLRGLVLDIRLAEQPSDACPSFGAEGHAVPVILGVAPSSLDHAVVTGLTMRLYLLEHDGGSLAIEVDDLHEGANLTAYSDIIGDFAFGS